MAGGATYRFKPKHAKKKINALRMHVIIRHIPCLLLHSWKLQPAGGKIYKDATIAVKSLMGPNIIDI